MPGERRYNARSACRAAARVHGPHAVLKGEVRSVSLGGVFFAGTELLAPGQHAEVEFELDGTAIRATTEVRYHYPLAESPGMGLRFLRLEPGHIEAIKKYVSTHATEAEPH